MGTELVHVGFGNFVAANRIVAAILPNSAPIQRLVRDSKKKGIIKDITQGRRTKAVLLMDDGSLILAAITPEAIAGRVRGLRNEGPLRSDGE
ncbi:MAG TPA: extracellular matrix/biofilm biosynthesis regulator RemA family protein [Dehalococcoidia bacterium]|nr:extracellular matrix/biofilm biosynthesis regulator RemA family protein [Dehalococcoidia bacterium]